MERLNIFLLLIPLLSLPMLGMAQYGGNINKLKPPKEFENIHVEKLYSDARSSSFVIWVKDKVRLHKHAAHTEQVVVLAGKGLMRTGEEVRQIKKGDIIYIPQGTPHSVKVTGGVLKVLSVQSPEFKGKDRIFLEE